MDRFCRFCGNKLKETSAFCRKCGKQVTEDAESGKSSDTGKAETGGNISTANATADGNINSVNPVKIQPSSQEDTKFCKSCGKKIRAGAEFCNYCGFKTKKKKVQTPDPANVNSPVNNRGNYAHEGNAGVGHSGENNVYRNIPQKKSFKSVIAFVLVVAILVMIVWGGVSVRKYQERFFHETTGEDNRKTPLSGYEKLESVASNGKTTGKELSSDDYQEEDEIGILTNISYSEQEISAVPAVTAEVSADDATVTVGDIYVDFGVMNLAEDCTLSVRELPEKKDSDNGYSMVAWDFDIGEQEEFFIPVEVRLPYDRNKVNDPYFELVPQHYNSQLGRWEDLEYEIGDDGYVTVYTQHFSPIGIARKNGTKQEDITKAKVSFTSAQWTETMKKYMNADDFNRLYNGDLEIAHYKDSPTSWIVKASTDFGDISTVAGTADPFFAFLLDDFWKKYMGHFGDAVSVLGFVYSCYNAHGDMIKKIDAENYGAVADYLYKEGPALAANGLSAMSGAAQMASALGFISQAAADTVLITPGLNYAIGGVLILKSYVDWKRERNAYYKVHFSEQGTYQQTYELFTYKNVMYDLENNELVWGLTDYDIEKLKNLRGDSDRLKEFGLTINDVNEMLNKGQANKNLQRQAIGRSNNIRKNSETGEFYAYGGYARIMQWIMERNPEEAENWLPLFDVYLERIAKVFTSLSEKEVYIFEAINDSIEPDYPGYLSYWQPKDYIKDMAFQLKYDLTSKGNNAYKDFIKLTKNAMWKETATLLKAEKTYINRKVKIYLYLTDEKGNEITFNQSEKYRDKYIILYSDPAYRQVSEIKPRDVNMDSLTLAESTFYGYLLWGAPQELRVYEEKNDYLTNKDPIETFFVPPITEGMDSVRVIVTYYDDIYGLWEVTTDMSDLNYGNMDALVGVMNQAVGYMSGESGVSEEALNSMKEYINEYQGTEDQFKNLESKSTWLIRPTEDENKVAITCDSDGQITHFDGYFNDERNKLELKTSKSDMEFEASDGKTYNLEKYGLYTTGTIEISEGKNEKTGKRTMIFEGEEQMKSSYANYKAKISGVKTSDYY